MNDRVQEFLTQFAEWAKAQSDIEAVVLVGSYARNAETEGSDIDLVIVSDQPAKYLDQIDWVRTFGQAERTQIQDYGRVISLRVWYTNFHEVEFGLTDQRWLALPLDPGTSKVISDGVKVLFERPPIVNQALPESNH